MHSSLPTLDEVNREGPEEEASVSASAPASSTTAPEASEEDAEEATEEVAAGNDMDTSLLDATIGQNQIEISLNSLPSETPEYEDALEDDTE